jgi:hypothetical protein
VYSLLRIGGRATAQGFEGLVITLFDKNVNLETSCVNISSELPVGYAPEHAQQMSHYRNSRAK